MPFGIEVCQLPIHFIIRLHMYKLHFFFLFIASAITLHAQVAIKPMWDKWLYRHVGQDALYSSDGSRIVTYTMQGFSVWDAKNGNFLYNFTSGNHQFSWHLFADSLVVFSGSSLNLDTNSVEIWNYYEAKRLGSFPAYRTKNIILDNGGKYVAICEEDKTAFTIWDIQNNSLFQSISTNSHSVRNVSFNSDASLVGYQILDTIYVSNIKENRVVNKFSSNNWAASFLFGSKANTLAYIDEGKSKTIFSDALTRVKEGEIETTKGIFALGIPEKNNCITGKYDTVIQLWDITTGKANRTFKGLSLPISDISFNADSTLLIASDGQSVCIWDFKTAMLIKKFSFDDEINGIAPKASLFSGTNLLITFLYNQTSVFDIITGEKKLTLKGLPYAQSIRCNESNNEILIQNPVQLQKYTLNTGVLSDKVEEPDAGSDDFLGPLSNDGKYFFYVENADKVTNYTLINTATKAKLWTYSMNKSNVNFRAEFSRNNSRIAVFDKPYIIVYDTIGNIVNKIDDKYGLSNFFMDAEGNTLFVQTKNTTYLIDINDDKYINWFEGVSVSDKYLSEPLSKLITIGDNTIDIYNIYTGDLLLSLGYIGKAPAAQFHPSEDKVLMFDKGKHSIKVIDAKNGSIIFSIYDTTAVNVNYDSKGKFIYSSADGINPKIYSATNGEYLADLLGSEDGVSSLNLSDNGNYAIGIGMRSKLMVWDLRSLSPTSVQYEVTKYEHQTKDVNVMYADKQLTVQLNEITREQENYTIYNMVGDMVAEGFIPANRSEFTLGLANCSYGVYYFKTEIHGKPYTQKFIVCQ